MSPPQSITDITTRLIEHAVTSVLAEARDIHTVILYGSAARGRLRTGGEMASDVDIAVGALQPLTLGRRLDLASRLARAMNREVDLVDLHAAHGLLLKEILTTGRFVRRDRPDFVAEKMIEMYDHELFLAPQLRAARRERIARLVSGSTGTRQVR